MKTVLICHEGDVFDQEGLGRWLTSFSEPVGFVVLRERTHQVKQRIRRELKRTGWLRFADILAFRLYYKLFLARQFDEWLARTMIIFQHRYGNIPPVPIIHSHSPNSPEVEVFLRKYEPDAVIARCKFLLKEHIFNIPKLGTFVIHPGICPEYRNSHGCFWALAQRDTEKVGATLLKVDSGIDTGPIFGYFTYRFDEKKESHSVIQQRCIFENLDAIASKLKEIAASKADPIDVRGRQSNVWGQPWMSKYLKWKLAARRG